MDRNIVLTGLTLILLGGGAFAWKVFALDHPLQPISQPGAWQVELRVTVHGRAAHQGVEPEKGVNAVLEAAHQILALEAINDLEKGSRVGANVIRGGTVVNVVADRVEIEVDARAWTMDEGERLDAALHGLSPVLPGARLEVAGAFARPPMEALPGSMALFERARRIGAALGEDLAPGRVGGASDGNFTAALGTATLDGLGPVGFADHTREEHILRSKVAQRLALLAGLLADLAEAERGPSGA